MKMSKALRTFLEEARQGDSYWVEKAKLQFSLALESRRAAAGMTYKAVADKLGTSAAYITKVFRGDSNVTIESMVKLAHATGGRLEVNIVDAAESEAEWTTEALLAKVQHYQKTGATSIPGYEAANVDWFHDQAAA